MKSQDLRTSERGWRARDRSGRSRFDRNRDRDRRGRNGRDDRGRLSRFAPATYWAQARRPLHGLAFVLPLLVVYEVGVTWLGGPSADALRSGADSWMRRGLAAAGQTDRWLPPLAIVLALLGWEALDPRGWRLSPWCLAGMALESFVLALALVGLSRAVDLGFAHLENRAILSVPAPEPPTTPPPAPRPLATLVGYLGAGLYEEALFRLALLPIFFGAARLLLLPRPLALALAMTGSALAFSLAHHAGAPGEPFTWYAFIFRWAAGVTFAWVFLARGFGIAVGTHAAYDILVGLVAGTS